MSMNFIRRIKSRIFRSRAPEAIYQGGGLPPSFLKYKDYISVHPSAIIGANAAIQMFNPPKHPEIVLEIGEGCHIFSTFSLLRREARIKVGRNCQLGASQFIAASRIDVSDDVIMAWGCTIIDTDNHAMSWSDRRFDVQRCREAWVATGGQDIGRHHDWTPVKMGHVLIGPKVWIGFNSIVLKGVVIGEGAVVGAGSVVTRSLEPRVVAAGNPCRVLDKHERSSSAQNS